MKKQKKRDIKKLEKQWSSGGKKILKKYGTEHFSQLGKKSAKKRYPQNLPNLSEDLPTNPVAEVGNM